MNRVAFYEHRAGLKQSTIVCANGTLAVTCDWALAASLLRWRLA